MTKITSHRTTKINMKIGHLGPEGTFSQQAAKFYKKDVTNVPYKTIRDVLMAVENDEMDMGVVPIENSIEGIVNATLDTLIFDTNLFIQSQLVLPISQNLMINKNNKSKTITKILSHTQALPQCQKFLTEKFNGVELLEVSSTAEASRIVSQSDEFFGAIGNSLCCDIYDLQLLHKNIQDNDNNKTYFIVVSKNNSFNPKIGFKTSMAFSTLNKPGELYKILDIFSVWDINMTKITSRPMKDVEGEYVFFVDIETSNNQEDMLNALTMIKRKTNFIKILGSYQDMYIN